MNPPEQFSLPPVHKLPALNLGLRPCAPSDWLDAPDAFGDDRSLALLVGVLSGGCSGYMYDLQIVENTDQSCQEININGFRAGVCTKTH